MDKESVKKYQEKLAKASSSEKDSIIAYLAWTIEHHKVVLKRIAKILNAIAEENPKDKKLNKEIKEIENTISLGIPGWVKYTRKTKKM